MDKFTKEFPVSHQSVGKSFSRQIDYPKEVFLNGKMIFPGQIAEFAKDDNFLQLIKELWKKNWVVYSKAPFNGPAKIFDYLGC